MQRARDRQLATRKQMRAEKKRITAGVSSDGAFVKVADGIRRRRLLSSTRHERDSRVRPSRSTSKLRARECCSIQLHNRAASSRTMARPRRARAPKPRHCRLEAVGGALERTRERSEARSGSDARALAERWRVSRATS